MKRVVIVGGGITGLAAAHALERAVEPCRVTLVEAEPRLGGNIVTLRHNGFIIDGGPDSWVTTKPNATRLAREIGLGDELIGTREDTRKVYVVSGRKLHPLPEGMVLGVPTSIRPFLETELFGLDAKLRAALDVVIPRRRFENDDDDESISSFVTRRLGAELAERIVAPLLGGIFAGDPDSLSVRACVPQLVTAEAEHGSLIMAMRAQAEKRKAKEEASPSTFMSLKRGIGDLVVNVAHRLRDAEVLTSTRAQRLERLPAGDPRGAWAVETEDRTLFADTVALLVPAYVASSLLGSVDASLASMLDGLGYASTATVFLAYKKFDVRHPLDATGFIVPRSEGRPVLACTFVSSKWEHRAPAGQVLLRVFFGGAGKESILELDDEELVKVARAQLHDLLGIERAPSFTRTFRFQRASPQPHVGHLGRLARIFARAATHEGLYLGGNGYHGTGIPDAIKHGEKIAARITILAEPEANVNETPREMPSERETQPSPSRGDVQASPEASQVKEES